MAHSDLHLGAHENPPVGFPGADETNGSDPLGDITSGIKAWFDVGISLGKQVEKQTQLMTRMMNRLQRDTPIIGRTAASGVCPASGILMLSLGKPQVGTYWDILGYVIGGTEQNVTAAGTAGLYISSLNSTAGATMLNMVDQATSLPDVGVGAGNMIVQADEHLFNVVFGGTSGQTYVANARYRVFNVAASGGKVITET